MLNQNMTDVELKKFFDGFIKDMELMRPSETKEELLVKAIVVSEIAGLNRTTEIVDLLVENRQKLIKV